MSRSGRSLLRAFESDGSMLLQLRGLSSLGPGSSLLASSASSLRPGHWSPPPLPSQGAALHVLLGSQQQNRDQERPSGVGADGIRAVLALTPGAAADRSPTLPLGPATFRHGLRLMAAASSPAVLPLLLQVESRRHIHFFRFLSVSGPMLLG